MPDVLAERMEAVGRALQMLRRRAKQVAATQTRVRMLRKLVGGACMRLPQKRTCIEGVHQPGSVLVSEQQKIICASQHLPSQRDVARSR